MTNINQILLHKTRWKILLNCVTVFLMVTTGNFHLPKYNEEWIYGGRGIEQRTQTRKIEKFVIKYGRNTTILCV